MRLPKYLKKSYTKENLEKKVLNRLQIDHDKDFLKTLFIENDGLFSIKEELSKNERTKLKKLVKEIKKGRAGVKIIPLSLLIIVIASGVVLTIFKNSIATELITGNLESEFGATVNLEGFNLSITNSFIKFDSLEVTDKNNLDKNLFELGSTELSFNTNALLSKKFVVEAMKCSTIEWGSLRDAPGALIGKSSIESKKSETDKSDSVSGNKVAQKEAIDNSKQKSEAVKEDKSNPVVSFANDFIDPEEFVDEQYNSLETPQFAEEKKKEYEKQVEEQKEIIDDIKSGSIRAISEGEKFLSLNINDYTKDPTKIPGLVKDVEGYTSDVLETKSDIEKEIKVVKAIKNSIESDIKELNEKRISDQKKVTSLISLPSGGIKEIFASLAKSYLQEALGSNYDKVAKVYEFIKKYRETGDDKKENEPGSRRGRVVSFEGEWPAILLEDFNVSVISDSIVYNVIGTDISSSPEKWTEPISFTLSGSDGTTTISVEGVVDRRITSDGKSSGDIEFSGFPLSSTGLSFAGINNFNGSGAGFNTLSVEKDGLWEMNSTILVSSIELEEDGSTLASTVVSILEKDDWELIVKTTGKGRDYTIDVEWPLLDSIDDEIGTMLEEQTKEYLAEVENELQERFSDDLSKLEVYKDEINKWEDELNLNLSDIDKENAEVEDYLDEIQNAAKKEAEKKAKKAATQGAKDAAKNLKKLF